MLKIKEGFILREVGGTSCVVAVGKASKNFKGMITLNETGVLLFKELLNGSTKELLTQKLLNEYEIDELTAECDVEDFIMKLLDGGIIEQ